MPVFTKMSGLDSSKLHDNIIRTTMLHRKKQVLMQALLGVVSAAAAAAAAAVAETEVAVAPCSG